MSRLISVFVVMSMAVAAGCGKKASAEGPQAWCEATYARRAKVMRIDKSAETRAAFLAECTTQPPEYLACEATDWMARRDERCAGIVKANAATQSRLNALLMTGRAP